MLHRSPVRRKLVYVLGYLHRTEMRAAHGTEVRGLRAFSGKSFIMELTRRIGNSPTLSTFSTTQLCADNDAYPNSNVVTPKISATGSSGIGPSTIRAQPKTSLIL